MELTVFLKDYLAPRGPNYWRYKMSKSKDDLSQSKLLLERGSVFESIVGVQKAGEIMKARIYNQIEPPRMGMIWI